VKAPDSRRPSRRRTPEELAQDHEDALRWRAKLRAEAGLTAETPAPAIATPKTRSERSRFAAAIARAEFGRFYFKPLRPGRSPKPVSPKPVSPKPVSPKPVSPKPVSPKPVRGRNGKAD
jgi:hypothetical protein